jgi:hypothetical protein
MYTLVGVVFALLKQHFQTDLTIGESEVVYDWDGSATTVMRYAVNSDNPNVPLSVILKRSNVKRGTLFLDAAGLRFVGDIAGLAGLFPTLYGVDYQQEVLVMEDLNLPKEAILGQILFGQNREVAVQGLVEFQRALARLHLATLGRQAEFETIITQYKKLNPSRHRVHRLLMCIAEFPAAVEKLGVEVSRSVYDELKQISTMIRDPQEFLAFTHGDGTLANVFFDGEQVKLYDLEACGFRHMLLDGTFARMRYIYSVWAREIPLDVQQLMFAAYRDTLADGLALAGDDAVFMPHYVGCCGAWLAGMAVSLHDVANHDQNWGRSTWRQRIVAAFEHFAELSAETGLFEALGELSGQVVRVLQGKWAATDCRMEAYPAFSDHADGSSSTQASFGKQI